LSSEHSNLAGILMIEDNAADVFLMRYAEPRGGLDQTGGRNSGNLPGAQPGSGPTKHRHECRSGTQECVRHAG
jgi:hypothetical protein